MVSGVAAGTSKSVKFRQEMEEQKRLVTVIDASASERGRSSSNVGGLHPIRQLDNRYLYGNS